MDDNSSAVAFTDLWEIYKAVQQLLPKMTASPRDDVTTAIERSSIATELRCLSDLALSVLGEGATDADRLRARNVAVQDLKAIIARIEREQLRIAICPGDKHQ